MLEIPENQKEHFNKVVEFAKTISDKLEESNRFQYNLDYLATYACHNGDNTRTKCRLYKDNWDDMSFDFKMYVKNEKTGEYEYWFNGGLVFHGKHDGFGSGSAPTFSVCLTATDGWSIHT